MLHEITKENYTNTENNFFASILKFFGEDLLLYCVTGSLSRNEVIPRWSDIDVLMVMKECNLVTLSKIENTLKQTQTNIKIGVTFYSLSEFNNLFFKDSKTYLSIRYISEKYYIPRILSSEIKIQLLPEEMFRHNDAFEFARFVHDLKRELLIKDIRNERKVYKLSITLLKIALRQRGVVALGYKETIEKAEKNLPNFSEIHIMEPEEVMAKPEKIVERYETYGRIIEWVTKNTDTVFVKKPI
ncbi:hypothetical protein A2917_02800 [Candidatus Nomurabacteria bacterium RIFCSPLOWO2_01_FULL_42_17]|uniref:Polymerase nucleotidyl transferase domain-containing protein n=1 Tax=Candidatus Nomurabacteria bacterium RIFCSPLOWO2_01_FULL_42_17 TaxID=1801780 RepID=A0A1F6XMY6_9BACT|nr:MAG: hypothetical protein A2917_02800 [Candidatus Nomurabacteria bacterium RIFCSPLOWO2_01_FULL_42_17]